MTRTHNLATRKPGRPLSFDRDAAVHSAMLLFWRHGYEATSLNQLTTAMGIAPPSLYAAFGDKKGLFLEAVKRYVSGPITSEQLIEQAATARDAAWVLLNAAAKGFTGADTPSGCLLASSVISCSASAVEVQQQLALIRRGIEAQLRRKTARAIRVGELPASADAAVLAGLTMAVIQGMSTLARDGASRQKLMGVAKHAMLAWPDVAGSGRSRARLR
jgi:AcrR family transcriptional regulator